MLALVLLAAASSEPLDELPLLAPIVDFEAQPASRDVPRRRLFHVGVSVSGFVQSGAQLGGARATVEIGVRFPFFSERFGLAVTPNASGAFGSKATFRNAQALIVGVPLVVSYHERMGPGHFRVLAGPSLDWSAARALDDSALWEEQLLSIGALGSFGYLLDAPPGKVLLEVGYRFASYLLGGALQNTHGAFIGVGYAFWL